MFSDRAQRKLFNDIIAPPAVIPVIVPPSHHVLVVWSRADLKPLDVLIGTKEEGVISRCVV